MMKRTEHTGKTACSKRRNLTAGMLLMILLLFAVSAVYVSETRTAEVVARNRELPVYSVDRDDGRIAISFDAAWGGDKTKKILDILDENGIKATFFLVDIWTQRFPELVKEIASRGHEIGNHSTTHPEMSKLSREKIAQELETMSANVESLIGKRPTLFRPPYGDYNNDVVLTARQNGYEVIQWSVDSLDWKNKGVQPLIDRATKNVKSGDIVLFHNDSQFIVEALPAVLESYRKPGLTVGPVSQVLLTGQTTIDPQGRQHPAVTTVPEV